MEVYVERKKKDDGVVTQYIRDAKSVYSYESGDRKYLHVTDSADEGSLIFDVIKFEVY